ncbi:jg27973, partial [Pararge aegeria aegeria]
MNITCEGEILALHLYQDKSMIPKAKMNSNSQLNTFGTSAEVAENVSEVAQNRCSDAVIRITKETRNNFDYYNTSVSIKHILKYKC